MGKNIVKIEVVVDENGRASASLKGLERDVLRFTNQVDKSGQAGVRLRDIFAGNLLADFFQRGMSAAAAFAAQSIRASAAAEDANRVLTFSATQAGLSYARATEQAEEFGRRVGASNTEAARTFADLIRLAERAGRSQDIDLIQRRLADLSAARGLSGGELQNLIGTILSGQDEGLNRLGLPDPSKLYAAYARELGKTAEALTETERAQAALNAVLAKGAEAEGASEARLRSSAGQLDSTRAAWDNLTVQIGDSITNSIVFRDTIDTISAALGGLITSHAQARRELAKGLTPREIAQRERASEGGQTWNAIVGGASFPFSAGFTAWDYAQLGLGNISQEEFLTRQQGTANAVWNPGQRQEDARTEQLGQVQVEVFQQQAEALTNQLLNFLRAQDAAQKAAIQSDFRGRLGSARTAQGLNFDEQIASLQALRTELEGLNGVFDATEAQRYSQQIQESIEALQAKAGQAFRTARDGARAFLSEMDERAGRDNPFVKLFQQMESASERAQARFGIFGREFAEQMAEIERATLRNEIALARFNSRLSALRDRQEAARLDRGIIGLTGSEQRQLDVFGARLSGAERSVTGRTMAEALRAGFSSVDPAYAARQQFDELQRLESQLAGLEGRAGAEARGALDARYQRLYESLPPEQQQAIARDRSLREVFAGAYGRDSERAQREIQDTIDRAAAGDQIRTDVEEQLSLLRSGGLDTDASLRAFLDISGQLSDNELTGDIRRGRAEALRQRADREERKEQDAEKRAKQLEEFIKALTKLITDRGIRIDGELGVTINARDGLEAARALPAAPAPQPRFGDGFTPGRRRPQDQL